MTIKSLFKITLLSLSLLTLSACQQETPINENSNSPSAAGNNYTGPAARDEDVRAFQTNLWDNINATNINRCGDCHSPDAQDRGENPQEPYFADNTDVNAAYDQAINLIDLDNPLSSRLVTKLDTQHNCWAKFDIICASSIKSMISLWSGGNASASSKEILLTAPDIKEPGENKNLPVLATDNGANSFEQTLYPLLSANCSSCHYQEGTERQQSPFFANPNDVDSSYSAAKSKINIDIPASSRFVIKVASERHGCWSDCTNNAAAIQTQIEAMSDAITPDQVNPNFVISKALNITADGIVASGGSRHEANLIALWEFKVGQGLTAFDTSGVEPAINLTLSGNVTWLGSYGLDFSGGRAWAQIKTSAKLSATLKSTGEYSLEAWVIPGNVSQEDVNIISYDVSPTAKNFALTQNAYSYVVHNRSSATDNNGEPFLSTEDAGELLQSTLQHVVVTYEPINGRKIYINGSLVDVDDPITDSTTITNWEDDFAFTLGSSSGGSKPWDGQLRMVAIHDKVLTEEQALQNFDAGVGQKYFLLFSVSDETGIDDAFIMFQVSQYDSYSYLFETPTFITLNQDWVVNSFTIKNMRIGINGREASSGQAFANLEVEINSANYTAGVGQILSSNGTIIALEKDLADDEFFITFEQISGESYNRIEDAIAPLSPPGADIESSDVGIKTFEAIYASVLQMTAIDSDNAPNDIDSLNTLYSQYRQQLPSVSDIDTFLSSHQMAIAQLALAACSVRVDLDAALNAGDRELFSNVDFTESAQTAFNTETKKGFAIDPLTSRILLNGLTSQPDTVDIYNALSSDSSQTLITAGGTYTYESLVTKMTACPVDVDPENPCNLASDIYTPARTVQIVKSLCAAIVGSAVTLVQ